MLMQLPNTDPFINLKFAESAKAHPALQIVHAGTALRNSLNGKLVQVAANVPRLDYNPATGMCNGLLREPSRQNLWSHSQQLDNVVWSKTRSTITAVTDPTCPVSGNVFKLTGQLGQNSPKIDRIVTTKANYYYCFSVFVKADGVNKVGLTFAQYANQVVPHNVRIDLQTGEIHGLTLTGGQWHKCGGLIKYPDGWWRLWLVTQATEVSGPIYPTIQLINTLTVNEDTYVGDGVNGILITGMQLEYGNAISSYIPTTTSAVVRASDNSLVIPFAETQHITFAVKYLASRHKGHIFGLSKSNKEILGIVGNTSIGGAGAYVNNYIPNFSIGVSSTPVEGEECVVVCSISPERIIAGNHKGPNSFRTVTTARNTTSYDSLTIGANNSSSEAVGCTFKDVLVYDQALTIEQCRSLANYLKK